MHRHIIDKPRVVTDKRLARYLALERRDWLAGPPRAVNILRRQPRGTAASARLQAFVQLARVSG